MSNPLVELYQEPQSGQPASAELNKTGLALQSMELGVWREQLLATSDIRIDGASNTWVWWSGTRRYIRYAMIGRTLIVAFGLAFTTTLPTAADTIYIRIPGNFRAVTSPGDNTTAGGLSGININGVGFVFCSDGGVEKSAYSAANHNWLIITKVGGADFIAGDTQLFGQIAFEIADFAA